MNYAAAAVLWNSRLASTALALAAVACASGPTPNPGEAPPPVLGSTPSPTPSAATSGPTAPPPDSKHPALVWVKDDMPAAVAQAKQGSKLVFVDAWAQWCHTCISMKEYVLNDPALRELADSVVFAEVDTDLDRNSAFVDKYAIDIWPTFFIIEPASGDVLGYWPGSGSLREMQAFIREALAARDARQAAKLDPKSPLAALLAGKSAQAVSQYDAAAEHYATAVKRAPADWPRRSEALHGWISALFNAGRADKCVDAGLGHLDEVRGVAKPTDYARTLMDCAEHASAAKRQAATKAVLAHLEKLVAGPHPESTPDDRADTLGLLSEVRGQLNDKAGAREALKQRFAILEKAAKDAPNPVAASTYDYARANAYLALGRPDEAVKMLQEREKQIPGSIEPPARLASVYATLKRYPEALAAIGRALKTAEGPRRIDYLETKAEIQGAMKDGTGQLATLQQVVAAYELQAKRQATKPQRLVTAKRRLEEAKKALAQAKGKP